MKLIIGIGNPGKEYEITRHNAGFLFCDFLSQQSLPSGIIIKKSSVFMNDSGTEAKRLVSKYPSILVSDLFIAHDDLDLKLGEYKIHFNKGPKDHNGIKSVDQALGTSEYWRIRIGVDNRNPEDRIPGDKYVLQKFTDEEIKVLGNIFLKIWQDLQKLVTV